MAADSLYGYTNEYRKDIWCFDDDIYYQDLDSSAATIQIYINVFNNDGLNDSEYSITYDFIFVPKSNCFYHSYHIQETVLKKDYMSVELPFSTINATISNLFDTIALFKEEK